MAAPTLSIPVHPASHTPPPATIMNVETLRCGAGFRDFCFVKMTTTAIDGKGLPVIGWSEYLEERNIGVTQVIEWMGTLVTGLDPLPYAKIIAQLKANTRHVAGGIAQQAIAAIENALLDVVGKCYGVPVCALFGGPFRTKLPVYWSHCGSFRVSYSDMLVNPISGQPTPPLNSLADVEALGREVAASGHTALKTNMFLFEKPEHDPTDAATNPHPNPNLNPTTGSRSAPPHPHGQTRGSGGGSMYMPGFGGGHGSPELNITPTLVETVVQQMRALRQGAGNGIGLKLDLNYNFKTDGYLAMARALTPEALGGRGLDWLELDLYSPAALRQIRDAAPMPIASLESIMGRRDLLPYLHAGSVDVCIIDPLWNGVDESVKMAALCDVYDVNCAAHNYHGWLGTVICAHFCAAIPNFKVLEVDVDDVPWKDDIVTHVPEVKDGVLTLPMRPGWGVDVDEQALKLHPALSDARSGIWSAATPKGKA
eukprot:m.104109 g.104109  ORF g.104109 m.104109 type:complete len:482 (+) comp10510_c0_seq2:83-1528(+)